MTMWRKSIIDVDVSQIEALEARVADLEKRLETMSLDIAYYAPQKNQPSGIEHEVSEPSTQAALPDHRLQQIRAALTVLNHLGMKHELTEVQLDESCLRAENITQLKRVREHNREAENNNANCRVPVTSQMAAWFIINYDKTVCRRFKNTDFAETLIGISELSIDNINFGKRESDRLALRWMTAAWQQLETVPAFDADLPF